MPIFYSEKFEYLFKKLPANLRKKADSKIKIFKTNNHNTGLSVHKLRGYDLWAFSIDKKTRVIFKHKDNNIILIGIGDHSIYKNLQKF
jgi:mRNA-degrading endonuclease YafQ of YafQ-DinJ toxin-antitoxin module